MNIVNMVQISRYNWEIKSQSGNVVQSELYFHNNHQAEQYIKNYISSFSNWHYKLIPLPKDTANDD